MKENLRIASDVAALGASRKAATVKDEDELEAFARQVLVANLKAQGAEVTDVTLTLDEKELTVAAEAVLPSRFAGVMGIDDMEGATSATAVWGGNPIELALVLDNTGSMEGVKMST